MPVEIKELHIKAVIAPIQNDHKNQSVPMSSSELQKLKKEIIREFMEKVFDKIQEKLER